MSTGGTASAIVPVSRAASFVEQFATTFGRRQAMLLKLAGFDASEMRGEGSIVIDAAGRHWRDFGSFGVHLLGHRHPAIVATVRRALDKMGLSTKILGNEDVVLCGEKLLGAASGRVSGVVFGNSGTETVEAAIRMASLATGRTGFAALARGYHGKSLGAAALTDTAFRAPVAADALAVTRLPRDDAEAAVAALHQARPAALFIELIQGEGGIYPLDPDYVRAVADTCRETGTLLIVDEIQTGLGRTGMLLESHRLGLEPDVLLLGKILGGGLMPASAALFDRARVGERASDPVIHSSTFAGGALAAAAASAVVDVISAPGFLEHVRVLGATALERLQPYTRLAGIDQVRGCGLMIGIEFADPGLCGEVVIEAAKRRLLVTFCLNDPRVLRIFPPAIASVEDLNAGLASIEESIAAAHDTWLRDEEAR